MNDFMISRNTFLDALVLDADNKTDLIQVHQALEKAVVDVESVDNGDRTGFWVDSEPQYKDYDYKKSSAPYYCSCCKHRAGKYKHKSYKYCPRCGARMLPAPPKEKGEGK